MLLIHGTGFHSFLSETRPAVDSVLHRRDARFAGPRLYRRAFVAGRRPLPGVAIGLAALLQELNLKPALAVGHSAGVVVELRMTLDGSITPAAVVSLNGALLPFPAWPTICSARQPGCWRAPASQRKRFAARRLAPIRRADASF